MWLSHVDYQNSDFFSHLFCYHLEMQLAARIEQVIACNIQMKCASLESIVVVVSLLFFQRKFCWEESIFVFTSASTVSSLRQNTPSIYFSHTFCT